MDVLPNLLLEEPLQASQLVLLVKNLPAKAGGIKDRDQSLGWEDLPEEGMTAGKYVALTIQTFIGNVMSLLFNTLYRFAMAFLPSSKCLLIS